MLELGARKTLLQPTSWGSYRYWLRCGDFDIFVGRGKGLPAIYARLTSAFIHEIGADTALGELRAFVELTFLPALTGALCSRADIYADFQGWAPRPHDYERFVTRSRRNISHIAVHHDGRRFTGFTFGRDAIVAGLYDKSAEIAHSGKDWMRCVWGDQLDPLRPVWRLEFQLRREALAECSLREPEDVLKKRQDLWTYAMRWLSLRSHRSRCQAHEMAGGQRLGAALAGGTWRSGESVGASAHQEPRRDSTCSRSGRLRKLPCCRSRR